jgi:hypothetical protein
MMTVELFDTIAFLHASSYNNLIDSVLALKARTTPVNEVIMNIAMMIR